MMRGTRGERNDGCRRVQDLRDSRIKHAFPPRCSPGPILADTLSTGFIRVTLRHEYRPFFFSTYTLVLRNICRDENAVFLFSPFAGRYLSFCFFFAWSLGYFYRKYRCRLTSSIVTSGRFQSCSYFKIFEYMYSIVFLSDSIHSYIMDYSWLQTRRFARSLRYQ